MRYINLHFTYLLLT